MLHRTQLLLTPFIVDADSLPADRVGLGHLLGVTILGALGVIALPLAGAVAMALASSLLQNGFVVTGFHLPSDVIDGVGQEPAGATCRVVDQLAKLRVDHLDDKFG